ncbi:Serine phosphatase RsbU, regulator of sigma subunit [Nonomuraea solani]|uniref:Serine phosphatase RsbU, regulator of sigma subunit n=1 Tax=Nonomuraea solani TaxID=1144553 RepID=A0A1H6DU19_9ACTN|nr:PP2C family protein-serine/threonine phosphatase [Nonomuraea solani]SEG88882.1 Serine phosphatase RsbU, regulator of sigma subunit [Nonomuraea solani]
MDPLAGYRNRLADLHASIEEARSAPEVLLAQASGLLAGRVGCQVGEAHAYLVRLAAEQRRQADALASDVLAAMEGRPGGAALTAALDAALRPAPRNGGWSPPAAAPQTDDRWVQAVQQILDTLSDQHVLLEPRYDAAGRVTDYTFAAVSPAVVDLSGRGGAHLLGRTMSEVYPSIVGGPIWEAWGLTIGDGVPREVGPVPYAGSAGREILLTVKMWPVGSGLLNTWIRHDEETRLSDRIAQTERLGNLGWGEWDLVTGQVLWSDGLYRIYERDPALGPLSREETEALTLADDVPVRRQAAEAFGRGQSVDVTHRIRLSGRIKYIRTVVDTVRDGDGQPVKVYGIVQDATARETSSLRLTEVERQLREHQESLAAEHKLAGRLQQIVLPMPVDPIDLPGLRVAVRYLPAEQAGRVGGDWYHAAPVGDGRVLLAVGDVAGHGIEAAAAMAQLRHGLAALSVTTTDDPGKLLTALNRLLFAGQLPDMSRSSLPVTATAVVARYEPGTGRLVWARAGHPAPLLSRAGVTTELDPPEGSLLGAFPTAHYETADATLRPGDVLLLYTDGLIEHRHRSLDDGLAPVVAVLDHLTAEPSAQPLAELLGRLRHANPDDDTCILAARPLSPEVGRDG